MKTATLSSPKQANTVLNAWYRDDIKPGTLNCEEFEMSLKKKRNSKSRDQEERYHAMLGDIAKQCDLFGKKLDLNSWKRLTVDAFRHETKDDPDLRDEWVKFGTIELLPALNHTGFVMVGEQTRKFSTKLASAYIEWLFAFGAEKNVMWKDPKWRAQMAEHIDQETGEITTA